MQLYSVLPKEAENLGKEQLRPQGGLSGNSSLYCFLGRAEFQVNAPCPEHQCWEQPKPQGLNTIFALSKFLHTEGYDFPSFSPGICSINTKKETVLWMERALC